MTDAVEHANHQLGIYFGGMAGQTPELPITYEGLEAAARGHLEAGPYGYVAGGAGAETTMANNREAFDRWRIVPRMLTDVGSRDYRVDLFGHTHIAPVILAPVGVQTIVHPEGELATARAAAELGLAFTLSTAASHTAEAVAEAAGDHHRWFQLYWPTEPALTRSFIQRAEDSGYSAIVVTLDTKILAWRPRDLATAYLPFLHGEGLANYYADPAFLAGLEKTPEEDPSSAVLRFASVFLNRSATWNDLAALREMTDLPLIVKGIQHPEDARLAVEAGVDGIVVSNHGGRQVDGAMGALEALPGVVAQVGPDVPVLFDSGVRTGADIFKAVALGATSVLVGRPWVWGLALAGQDGVKTVLANLLAEWDLTMSLAGKANIADITRADLVLPGQAPH